MRLNQYVGILLCAALFFTACKKCDDDGSAICFDTADAKLQIVSINNELAANCPLGAAPCPVICENATCTVSLSGTSAGLAGQGCVFVYIWIKGTDDNLNRYQTRIPISSDGTWTANPPLLPSGNFLNFGDSYEIWVTVSPDEITQNTIQTFAGINIVEHATASAVVEITDCFDPNEIVNFQITHVNEMAVVNNRVDSIDCSIIEGGEFPCRIEVRGTSSGIFSQRSCSDVVLLLEPFNTDIWYPQGDLPEPNEDGSWDTTIQLGGIPPDENSPKGEVFKLSAYVTTVNRDDIPAMIPNDMINDIFPPSNSFKIFSEVTVTVKH